ncbi:DUF883 family protein (plasmid) [Paracoccus liaowanqingii]|uniref:DUF883 family protein n=1 Tax=Paracoccus liaowanqingii TaxID=2560053 RepID=A0A4Y5SVT5_9RHOB|nr:DUF883 family protein [Paracoccus liaowanqingii]QDA36906.1 DUF883 family protein [Paracoccus liaowanqingii]
MAQKPTAELEHATIAPTDDPSSNPKIGAAGLAKRGAALASDAAEATRAYVAPLQEAGQDYAGRLVNAGHQKAQEAAFYAELGYEETRDLVRGYPIRALGIAAGIGVLIGLLTGRR